MSEHFDWIVYNNRIAIAAAKSLNPDINMASTNVETMSSGERVTVIRVSYCGSNQL